jgi:hypothetical protein
VKNTSIEINWGGSPADLPPSWPRSLGVEIILARATKRPGWFLYEFKSLTPKFKIKIEPGYTFMGINYAGGKYSALSKWRALHPQTFPSTMYKPIRFTYVLATETWYDVVRSLLEVGARVKSNKKQFERAAEFEKYCDTLGVYRIIQAEWGLNK